MSEAFYPELGQLAFSNSDAFALAMDGNVEAGLSVLGHLIEAFCGVESPMSNTGSEYENDRFVARAYCWCDGERHPDGCPPNFVHKPSGFSCCWYKHSLRGNSQNGRISKERWNRILRDCIVSVLKETA